VGTVNAENPDELVDYCDGCHGRLGYSLNEQVPNLAGQHYQYLMRQIMLLNSDEVDASARKHPVMWMHTAHLKKSDLQRIAEYFA